MRERFVRLDGIRRKEGSDPGLGPVDAIPRLHGATLLVENNEPGLKALIRVKTKLNTVLIGSRTQDKVLEVIPWHESLVCSQVAS